MQLGKLLSCLLIGFVFVLVIIPSAHAQITSVTIIIPTPPNIELTTEKSNGTASFTAEVQVSYAGLLQQASRYEVLVVALSYFGLSVPPNGTTSSVPNVCLPSGLNFVPSGQSFPLEKGVTVCTMLPFASSETETVLFHGIINNAVPQHYHFNVLAGFVAITPQMTTITQGSTSTADFYVSVVNGATTAITSQTPYTYSTPNGVPSTPSLQLLEPPQPIISSLALVGAVIAAIVLLLDMRRTAQPEVTEAENVDSTPKKSGKNFCIECGSELPLGSKFCNNCGTKQP
jgi:hypothetical protein